MSSLLANYVFQDVEKSPGYKAPVKTQPKRTLKYVEGGLEAGNEVDGLSSTFC